MRLVVLEEARAESLDAAVWYDQQRTGLGTEFLTAVESGFARIVEDPKSLPLWELTFAPFEFRRCLLQSFPFTIIFVIDHDDIVVVAVSHGRRHPAHWADRWR